MNKNRQGEIDQQLELLKTHRSTLAHYLRQQAQMGSVNIPPSMAHGIADARDNIRRIKHTLRDWGVAVDDYPDDGPPVDDETYAVKDTKNYRQQKSRHHLLVSSVRSSVDDVLERKKREAAESRSFDFGSFQRDEDVGPSKLGTEGLARLSMLYSILLDYEFRFSQHNQL